MNELRTPDGILRELVELRERSAKGVEILREAEEEMVAKKFTAESAELAVFVEAGGTVADRQAIAKIKSIEERQEYELAKVKVNYIKGKLDQLKDAQMNVQTQARLVETLYRGAGLGER